MARLRLRLGSITRLAAMPVTACMVIIPSRVGCFFVFSCGQPMAVSTWSPIIQANIWANDIVVSASWGGKSRCQGCYQDTGEGELAELHDCDVEGFLRLVRGLVRGIVAMGRREELLRIERLASCNLICGIAATLGALYSCLLSSQIMLDVTPSPPISRSDQVLDHISCHFATSGCHGRTCSCPLSQARNFS